MLGIKSFTVSMNETSALSFVGVVVPFSKIQSTQELESGQLNS